MELNIINPAAGKGASVKAALSSACSNHYYTTGIGDAEKKVFELLRGGKKATLHVFGGDGTLNEVINGIMAAKAASNVKLSIHSVGTGNDFARNLNGIQNPVKVDLIRCNDRYAINMLNIGFDCRVVTKCAHYKKIPLVSGTGSYILGVVNVLALNRMETLKIDIINDQRESLHYDGDFLLTAIGNGAYCGGGFKAASAADISDGILDMVLVNPLKRRRFISLISDYKAGTHYSPEHKRLNDRFIGLMEYIRCLEITISGFHEICLDGEVIPMNEAKISVIPRCLTFIPAH